MPPTFLWVLKFDVKLGAWVKIFKFTAGRWIFYFRFQKCHFFFLYIFSLGFQNFMFIFLFIFSLGFQFFLFFLWGFKILYSFLFFIQLRKVEKIRTFFLFDFLCILPLLYVWIFFLFLYEFRRKLGIVLGGWGHKFCLMDGRVGRSRKVSFNFLHTF